MNKLTNIWVRVWKLKLNLIMDKLPVGWFKQKKKNSSCVYFYPKYTFGANSVKVWFIVWTHELKNTEFLICLYLKHVKDYFVGNGLFNKS